MKNNLQFRVTSIAFKSWLGLFCCLLIGTPQSQGQSLEYKVSFPQAKNHYVNVQLTIQEAEENQEVYLPVWTPGSYLVREYSRHIVTFVATNEKGEELPSRKTTKNRWKTENPAGEKLIISYRIYCNEMTVRTNFVDQEFALLNGAATYLTVESRSGEQHQITIEMPDNWRRAATSLKRQKETPHRFVAENHSELVDSPIVVGNPTVHPFEAGGVTHHLVNLGGDALWNGDEAALDVAKVVEEHQSMWDVVPYDRYFFLNVISESGGGLEHDNSTVMLTSRWSFRNRQSYKRWLGLVSHEFFHTWNIRRLRPKVLVNYDFENENYFDELWVGEGVTSYYDDLALARSGITSQNEYISALSRQISSVESTPGRNVQSLALSSHDAWIKYYRPDENSRNTSISYYTKGSLAAFLLDMEIRRATEDKKSLDDVMQKLWADHSGDVGYTNDDVMRIASEIGGFDAMPWFKSVIYSTDALDYSQALNWLGLQFAHEANKPSKAEASWLGMSSSSDDGRLIVKSVVEDGPAFDAGINVDDELIALNGYRLGSSLGDKVKQLAKDDQIELLIARRGKLHTIELKLAEPPLTSYRIIPVKKPTEQQQASLRKWLHQKEPVKKETPINKEAPAREEKE